MSGGVREQAGGRPARVALGTWMIDDPLLQTALQRAEQRGLRLWLVGGAVRDTLLGKAVKDLDAVADSGDTALVHALAREIADAVEGSYVPLDEDRGIARVVLEDGRDLDLAARVGPDLEHDLRHRDFTLNAMALDPATGEIHDPTGGQADLARGLLRTAGPDGLTDDPLRLLRGARMLCVYPRLQPAPGLADEIRRLAHLLPTVSWERIRDELFLCFRAGISPRIPFLVETGLLEAVLPELTPTRTTTQNHYHHTDVFHHTLEVLRYVEESSGPPLGQEMAGRRTRGELLKLTALLHDIGKPLTRTVDPDGRIRFFGHEALGAEMAEAAGRRLALSSREIQRLKRVVALHLEPVLLPHRNPTDVDLHRFFRAAGEAAPELLLLSDADVRASRGLAQTDERLAVHRAFVRDMLAEFLQEGRVARPKVPLTGADLVAAFGLSPGPTVGRLLERVAEAVAEGSVRSREQALAWAAESLSSEVRDG